MESLITFIMSYIVIMIIYYFYYIMFSKRGRHAPIESLYLIKLYNLDINKFSYRKFLKIVGLTTSLDVAIATTVVFNFDKLVWQILFAIITVIPVIVISFILVGKYYQKKQLRDNTKELERENKQIARQEKFEKMILGGKNKKSKKKKGND